MKKLFLLMVLAFLSVKISGQKPDNELSALVLDMYSSTFFQKALFEKYNKKIPESFEIVLTTIRGVDYKFSFRIKNKEIVYFTSLSELDGVYTRILFFDGEWEIWICTFDNSCYQPYDSLPIGQFLEKFDEFRFDRGRLGNEHKGYFKKVNFLPWEIKSDFQEFIQR